ncbi:putative DNA binding domain-containing protein, partial [bacterium]|nr:putative DNA binding domain-containing protein [bacterium]
KDGGESYTESQMNGRPETQTAKTFELPEYRFLVVANKFQTGFDQALLHTMYVDKKLGGVNAVQTLSRLNRTHPDKTNTIVLDFENDADHIRMSFEPYYTITQLSEQTDPNLLYETQSRLLDFGIYTESDVNEFAKVYFTPKITQDRIYSALASFKERFMELSEEERHGFRSMLNECIRLYSFLSQVLTFADADLEKLHVFARMLRRYLPAGSLELPREIQQNIDMESYRIQQISSGKIALERRAGLLDPKRSKEQFHLSPEQLEPLSQIISELNERFGLNLGPEHRLTLNQMMEKLDRDPALDASARVNTRENVKLAFNQKVEDVIQEIVDSNFELYKRITDDPSFGNVVKNFLFDQYLRGHRNAEELLRQNESATLEFKSSLRWSLKENKEDKAVTFAVMKTIAAFLNTEGGDLLIGVADDRTVLGLKLDQLENDDKFMRHLMQMVRNSLGDRASTCVDPITQIVQGKNICLVSCRRSPEPVFLKWKSDQDSPEGDFYVRSGPGTVKLSEENTKKYIKTRFGSGRTNP